MMLSKLSDKTAWYYLETAYRLGINEVSVTLDGSATASQIRTIIKDLPGWEVVRQGKNQIHIKDISVPKEDELAILINRTLHLLADYAADCVTASRMSTEELHAIAARGDESINRVTDMCSRIVLSSRRSDAATLLAFISRLEDIGDEIGANAYLALHAKKNKATDMLALQESAIRLFTQSIFSATTTNLDTLVKIRRDLLKKSDDNLSTGVSRLCKLLVETGIQRHVTQTVNAETTS